MRTLVILLGILILSKAAVSQVITSVPALPNESQSVTITFDALKGAAGLKDYTGDVYAHIGVITDKSSSSSDWKYVVAAWGTNVDKAKMTRIGLNQYQLIFTPDIRKYFAVPAGEVIQKVAMVFRSGVTVNGSYLEGKDTGGKDIFMDVYAAGLNFVIQQPTKNQIFQPNSTFLFSANASTTADLELYLNNVKLKTLSGTNISNSFNLGSGDYWIKAKAITSSKTIADSLSHPGGLCLLMP